MPLKPVFQCLHRDFYERGDPQEPINKTQCSFIPPDPLFPPILNLKSAQTPSPLSRGRLFLNLSIYCDYYPTLGVVYRATRGATLGSVRVMKYLFGQFISPFVTVCLEMGTGYKLQDFAKIKKNTFLVQRTSLPHGEKKCYDCLMEENTN